MKPIDFPERNAIRDYRKSFRIDPVHSDDYSRTWRYRLTLKERLHVLFFGELWLTHYSKEFTEKPDRLAVTQPEFQPEI
jgi:hypothetical protein